MKTRRLAALLMALLLVAGACSKAKKVKTGPRSGKYGDPNAVEASPTPKAAATAAAPTAGTAPRSGSTTKPTQRASSSPGVTGGIAPGLQLISDTGGNACKPILQPSAYTEIVLEVDWVSGREPSPGAVSHVVNLLKRETGKPVTLKGGNLLPSQGGNYDEDKIQRIAAQRNTKSEVPVASLWVGYLDGTTKGGGAAGVAWGGTIATVFMDTIDGLPFPPSVKEGIEKTIIVQEIFHLLCMVNIGYKSPRDHEDRDHPRHSKNPNSVMYWALMTREGIIPFISNGGSPPTDFDSDDRADLADIRAGRL